MNSSQKGPLTIDLNKAWNAGGHNLLSIKTPTTLLLDLNKQLVAFGYQAENRYTELEMDACGFFGYQAENRYTELEMDGKFDGYYYFHRFKLKLFEKESLSTDSELSDIRGKSVPAKDVFASSIRFLKQHLISSLSRQGVDVADFGIQWVLTVPSIWSDSAKQFIRQCAVKAGIQNDSLVVSLESEAASIFCHHISSNLSVGTNTGVLSSKKGTQYMVVDMGGGTSDITALENIGKNKLKEICRACGADCGGIAVDNAFYTMFMDIVGQAVIDDLISSSPTAHLDLFREFECVKRSLTPEQTGKVTMSIPFLTLTQICEKHHHNDFVSLLKASKYNQQMTIVNDKLRIEVDLLKLLFKPTTDKIVNLIKDKLHEIQNKKAINVILVGGFSESLIVQHAIKTSIPSHHIIVPNEATLAVLKGAVIFGTDPNVIVSRVVRHTYGFQVSNDFDPKLHEFHRQVEVDELELCEKVFEKFMVINSTVSLGQKIKETFTTTKKFQELHYLPLFTSTKKEPGYTDDKTCKHAGNVVVRIPNPTEKYRDIDVTICFGHTELQIEAVDVESGNMCQTTFEYV
ncbi:unnamed protein product [Mytilus edulis]|uniref:Uncharacterized protein n=1 Tax=Mytilus edulis TaxID=6550 RepID=A0A8S3RJW1_MYTED|nr:unnamed protein product [Mytilus edulis]